MEQTGRLLFELKHKPSEVKLIALINNRSAEKKKPLVAQKIPVSNDSVSIDNFFVSEHDTVALVSKKDSTLHVYNIVNRAKEFFKSDLQVDISSELNFESEINWIPSDDGELLLQTGSSAFKLNLNESSLNVVSKLNVSSEKRFVEYKKGQFILESSEGNLVIKSELDVKKSENKPIEDIDEDLSQKIVEQFSNPAQLLQTLKNTSTVEFAMDTSTSCLLYTSPSPRD